MVVQIHISIENGGIKLNKTEAIECYVDHIIGNLYDLKKEDLMEAWCKLGNWQWDNKIGKRPIVWESLHRHKHTFADYFNKRITKSDFTVPIINQIESMVGRKALLRYLNVKYNKMTDEDFDGFWDLEIEELEDKLFEEVD